MLVLGLIIIAIGKTVLGEQLIADIGTMISVIGVGLISFKGISLLRSPSSSLIESKALPGLDQLPNCRPLHNLKGCQPLLKILPVISIRFSAGKKKACATNEVASTNYHHRSQVALI